MREFNRSRAEPVRFSMDGDVFDAVPEIPATMMVGLVKKFAGLNDADGDPITRFEQALDVLRQLLTPDSRETFERRLSDSANPIGLRQVTELVQWLLGEVYGQRPTQPPSPSPESPSDGGLPSTDGAPPADSTNLIWPGAGI